MKNFLSIILLVLMYTDVIKAQELKNALGWTFEYKTISTYGSNNQRTNSTTYQWNPASQKWDNYSKFEYSYDSQNLLKEAVYSIWDTSLQTWVYNSGSTYTFYAFNKMWDGTSYTWDVENKEWKEHYKYDDYSTNNNNTLFRTYYYWTGSKWSESKKYKVDLTLDSKNRISKQVSTEYRDDLYGYYGNKSTITLTYDVIGNVIASESPNSGNTYYFTFTFDNNGNPIERITHAWDSLTGSFTNKTKLVYKYDSSGKQLEYTEYTNDYSTGVQDLNANTSYVVFPNPVKDVLYLNNSNENLTVSISDINGRQIINQQKIDNSINISCLLPGAYILNIYSSGKITPVKFVKQ